MVIHKEHCRKNKSPRSRGCLYRWSSFNGGRTRTDQNRPFTDELYKRRSNNNYTAPLDWENRGERSQCYANVVVEILYSDFQLLTSEE